MAAFDEDSSAFMESVKSEEFKSVKPSEVKGTASPRKTPPKSPTRKTYRSGSKKGAGLSELSKQLRIMQAKNEAQGVEVDRLERQLRILSDLQGLSVNDLRNALQDACEAEAHGELQHRVASLRAQLEAASLAKEMKNSEGLSNEVADLQLRVGELEELDEKQKEEIKYLYVALRDEKEKNAQLEEKILKQEEKILKQEEKILKQVEMAHEKPVSESVAEIESSINLESQLKIEALNERLASTEQQRDRFEEDANLREIKIQVLNEKLALTEQQRDRIEEDANLRQAQYKARFLVHEERIQDMDQQLSSLYTAFLMLSEERNEDVEKQQRLQNSLNAANEEVARQVSERDRGAIIRPVNFLPNTNAGNKTDASVATAPDTPSLASPGAFGFPREFRQGDRVIAGELLLRRTRLLQKTWKPRHAVMYAYTTHFELDFGEGKNYSLHQNVTRVDSFEKRPYAFVIKVNAFDANAAVLHVAAKDENSMRKWLSALSLATNGLPEELPFSEDYSIRALSTAEDLEMKRALEESSKNLSLDEPPTRGFESRDEAPAELQENSPNEIAASTATLSNRGSAESQQNAIPRTCESSRDEASQDLLQSDSHETTTLTRIIPNREPMEPQQNGIPETSISLDEEPKELLHDDAHDVAISAVNTAFEESKELDQNIIQETETSPAEESREAQQEDAPDIASSTVTSSNDSTELQHMDISEGATGSLSVEEPNEYKQNDTFLDIATLANDDSTDMQQDDTPVFVTSTATSQSNESAEFEQNHSSEIVTPTLTSSDEESTEPEEIYTLKPQKSTIQSKDVMAEKLAKEGMDGDRSDSPTMDADFSQSEYDVKHELLQI